MPTPSWIGATADQLPLAAQVNQFLGTHAAVPIYTGTLFDNQSTAGTGSTNSNGLWIAQKFTAGATYTSGRVVLTLAVTGSPAPWVITLRPDSAGAPSATVLATINLPNGFLSATGLPVSMPMLVPLASGTTYWIVAQAVGDASNNYAWLKSNQVSGTSTSTNGSTWTAQAYGSLFQVFAGPGGSVVHTFEDSGARWTTLALNVSGQLATLNEYTAAQGGSYVQSAATLSYTSGQLTGVAQSAANASPTSWRAARSGLLGDPGATNFPADVNQFLVSHPATVIYQGSSVLTPNGSGGAAWAYQLSTQDLDQPFTMSGTTIGRVVVPVLPVGAGADLIVSLCNDSGGNPGTVITKTRIPANWVTQLAAVEGIPGPSSAAPTLQYTNNPLALSQFNSLHMGTVKQTNWSFPNIAPGFGAPNGSQAYYGNYMISTGAANGSTFYNVAFTIGYDALGNLAQAIPQPGMPQVNNGTGVTIAATDPATGNVTVVLAGGKTSGGAVTPNVYTGQFNPATGQIASWTAQASLPQALWLPTVATWNGYVYVIGGINSGTTADLATVYYGQVQNGQITAWNTASPYPLALDSLYATAINGFLVVFGGENFSTTQTTAVYYAPINSDGSLGAWQAGPSLPAASVDFTFATPTLGSYAIMGVSNGQMYSLGFTSSGPDIAWQTSVIPNGGLNLAEAVTSPGQWMHYGIYYTYYVTCQLTLTPRISVPLPTTGLTNGATYHIVLSQAGGTLNDYLRLHDDLNVFPGNPTLKTRLLGSSTWVAGTTGHAVPIQVFDQTVTGTVWHTWEDSGARISTLAYATTPDQRLLGILEGTAMSGGPVLNQNPTFTAGVAPWVANGGTVVRSSAQVQGNLPFSAQLTPNGVAATVFIESEQELILQGHSYALSVWLLSAVGYANAFLNANWYDATHTFLSSSGVGGVNLTANTWTRLTATVTPPTGALYATLAPGESGTPPATAVVWVSAATLRDASGPMLGTVGVYNWSGSWPNPVWPPLGVTQLA